MSIGALGKTVGAVRGTEGQRPKFGNFDKSSGEKGVEITENIVTDCQ